MDGEHLKVSQPPQSLGRAGDFRLSGQEDQNVPPIPTGPPHRLPDPVLQPPDIRQQGLAGEVLVGDRKHPPLRPDVHPSQIVGDPARVQGGGHHDHPSRKPLFYQGQQ